jgi:hypothetical protein
MASPLSILRRLARSVRFARFNHRSVFSHIYENRYWGDRESVSGLGSSVAQTQPIRKALPELIVRHQIRSMIDAPCGDLHWMKLVLGEMGIRYMGGDVVPQVVELARSNNAFPNAIFCDFDITKSDFPDDVDLWLCRDVLFHFSYHDLKRALVNFGRSKIPYVLVTSHIGDDVKNRPIVTGDFRQLNLFKRPFRLKESAVIDRFIDYVSPLPPREMLMLRREDFVSMLP